MKGDRLVFTHKMPFSASPIFLSAFGQYTDSITFLLAQAMSAFVSIFELAQIPPKMLKIAEDAHRRCSSKEQVNIHINHILSPKMLKFPSVSRARVREGIYVSSH